MTPLVIGLLVILFIVVMIVFLLFRIQGSVKLLSSKSNQQLDETIQTETETETESTSIQLIDQLLHKTQQDKHYHVKLLANKLLKASYRIAGKRYYQLVLYELIDKLRNLNVALKNKSRGLRLVKMLIQQCTYSPSSSQSDITRNKLDTYINDTFNSQEDMMYIIYPELLKSTGTMI